MSATQEMSPEATRPLLQEAADTLDDVAEREEAGAPLQSLTALREIARKLRAVDAFLRQMEARPDRLSRLISRARRLDALYGRILERWERSQEERDALRGVGALGRIGSQRDACYMHIGLAVCDERED